MEKQKKWQFYIILGVILLTFYNILPTVFYYAQPLKKPIDAPEATAVTQQIANRVNALENFTVSWLQAQAANLKLKPLSVSLDPQNPKLAHLLFKTENEANLFAKTLFRAGALIPFVPAELAPVDLTTKEQGFLVTVQRKVGVHFAPEELATYFHYIPKRVEGNLTPEYRQIVEDRASRLALALGGESEATQAAKRVLSSPADNEEEVVRLSRTIVDYENTFGEQNPLTQRYYGSFTQGNLSGAEKNALIPELVKRFEKVSEKLQEEVRTLRSEKETKLLSSNDLQKLEIYTSQKNQVDAALAILRRNQRLFEAGNAPLTTKELAPTAEGPVETYSLGNRNPFVNQVVIDWNKETLELVLHPDVQAMLQAPAQTEAEALREEKLQTLLFNTVGRVTRSTDEKITETASRFVINLNELTNSSSLLVLDLKEVAKKQLQSAENYLHAEWNPTSELVEATFPHFSTPDALTQKKLGLIFYSPLVANNAKGFNPQSLYVIVRGFESLAKKYESLPESSEKTAFQNDFSKLATLMQQMGFSGYPAAKSPLSSTLEGDYVFELEDAYAYLLAATREHFTLSGAKNRAILEFTDVEQRLLTTNKIETQVHEDLVKWKDAYQSVQISLDPQVRADVPPPTENVLWSNLKLSTRKYFRGDERKVLKWGLDLSGGKTVRIGLKDQNNQPIVEEAALREAINELYARVNKLGVSEVSIRQEGSGIVLDFPGSQGLSAQELIKASAMYFHVVNEKFSPHNPLLREAVNTFLEEVWNEAVITNRKDPEGINALAWEHLGGSVERSGEFFPKTSHAKLLYDNGLRIAGPKEHKSSAFNDTLSQVSLFRGENFTNWFGQTNPLVIVFHNYALEGSNLTDIKTGYDPSEGNLLFFNVKGSDVKEGQKVNPRDDFYAWTSQFSEEKIGGTPKEAVTQGRGWRMAVILNGSVVSAPALNSPLRDSARITGHFSQREINALAADLKAGSLSFTPHILSEENVSPDLGKEQRTQGIMAALVGVLLVVGAMIAYYRFGGLVACVAVTFNLVIIWAVLQNLGAALTLPGIAGIILTVGMAVDANVLVFERIREEFAKHQRLPSAIAAGYRKAFTAILDSNLTTIIAAVILLNFDSGPIKGFALTLIIGIVSSMFTSLFMTRYFFARWVQNPEHKKLSMARLFHNTHYNFLKNTKVFIVGSVVVILVGLYLLVAQRTTIFGMDFTGGYALTLELEEKGQTDYRMEAEKALVRAGAHPSDFQVRELTRPTQLRFQLGVSMEEPGKPFYKIEDKKLDETPLYTYQQYPRMVWIVQALENQGLKIQPSSLSHLNLHWTEMSGQLSDTMRNQALIGLAIAFLAILLYITFRFEFNYALSATIGLAHDVLITMGALAIIHLFYEGVQIDLQVVAAIMTIVGYSLNDTIIIFDRIREDVKLHKKLSFKEIVNVSLNSTLSRTMMTSGTTLLVLLALVILGGKSIFSFSLIMTIGVVVGTLSSLFVAAPMLVYFHNRSVTKKLAAQEEPS